LTTLTALICGKHLGPELRLEDAAEIRSKRAGKQKTDRQDAQLLLVVTSSL
jgi:hypothetical protein